MKKFKLMVSVFAVAAVFASGIMTFLIKSEDFSETENRYLQKKPEISIFGVISADFQKQISDYISDRFPFRDFFVALNTRLLLLSGRKEIADTYIGKDGYCFEKVTDGDISRKQLVNNLKAVERLVEENKETDFTVLLVPSSAVILKDKMPENAPIYDAAGLYETAQGILTCRLINPTSVLLSHSDEYIYYRTDHHWTLDGAYYTYRYLTGGKGKYRLEYKTASDSFLGTLHSRTAQKNAVCDIIYQPLGCKAKKIIADSKQTEMFDFDALKKKDQYRFYFGGNHSIMEITGSGNGSVLIIKDSFANCFIPFLCSDYRTLTVIDPRFFAGSISSLFDEHGYDECLVLYELNNFAVDTDVIKIGM